MKHILIIACLAQTSWPVTDARGAEHRLDVIPVAGFAFALRSADGPLPGGPDLSVTVRYRTGAGVGAFISAGWVRLFSRSPQALDSWNFGAGVALDWWKLRLDAGLSASVLALHVTVDDTTIHPVEPALTYTVGLTGVVWEGPVDLGIQLLAHVVSGMTLAWLTLSVTIGMNVFESGPPSETR